MAYGDKPFGIRDIKLTDLGGSPTQVDLPVAQKLKIAPRISSNELKGGDSLKSVVAFVEAAEWELEAGGISLEALAKLIGGTATTSGTTPNRTTTLSVKGGMNMPYVKIYGKALGEGADDIHCLIYKAKVTEIDGEFANGEFFISSCKGIAVDDDTNGVYEFVQNETADDLPAT
jgi:hypothetical protein